MDFSSVIVATILTAALSTILMGLYANYPFALAPGMGMNAYFTYSVVQGMQISWEIALGIVFISGVILLLLWITGLRETVIRAVPKGIKIGTTAGVGLFLVVIALSNAKIIVSHPKTLLQLGNLMAPEAYLTFIGILIIAVLLSWRVPGAILIGILANWIWGMILGFVQFKGIVDLPHFDSKTFLALDLQKAFAPGLWMAIFSFLFICLFDSSGSLMGIAHQGRFLNKEGRLPRLRRALLPDGMGTFCGSLLGTSPTVVYVESASGVVTGGRTGLCAFFIAALFVFKFIQG
jgi:AGZA family xanthine/uracil permease-like MFS transporter